MFLDQPPVVQAGGCHLGGDLALLHEQHARRQSSDHLEVLLDQQDREIPALPEGAQMIDDLLDDRGLDAFARLVEQHQARPADQAARERQDLLLAAGERARRSGRAAARGSGNDATISATPRCPLPSRAPIRRFSRTVRSGKMPAPWGT